MEEKKKTKRQLEKEAALREQANRSFLRGTELLVQWMAFKDFILNDFYQAVLNLATEKEDQGEADDFGFSIFLYNTNMMCGHPHFFSTGKGLCGLSALVSRVTEWLDEEIKMLGDEHEPHPCTEAPQNFTVAWEMQNGCLHEGLSYFANDCETLGNSDHDVWVNLRFDFHPTKNEVPKEVDFANIETESLCYPDSLQKRFESILNDMTDN